MQSSTMQYQCSLVPCSLLIRGIQCYSMINVIQYNTIVAYGITSSLLIYIVIVKSSHIYSYCQVQYQLLVYYSSSISYQSITVYIVHLLIDCLLYILIPLYMQSTLLDSICIRLVQGIDSVQPLYQYRLYHMSPMHQISIGYIIYMKYTVVRLISIVIDR